MSLTHEHSLSNDLGHKFDVRVVLFMVGTDYVYFHNPVIASSRSRNVCCDRGVFMSMYVRIMARVRMMLAFGCG